MSLLLAASSLSACAEERVDAADYRAAAGQACPAANTGRRAVIGSGHVAGRVARAMERAGRAARALNAAKPPPELRTAHAGALHVIQGQVARLRAVSEQIQRGSDPQEVLAAARAGLEQGDTATRDRLAKLGVRACGATA